MVDSQLCPRFEAAFQLLGKRWSGLIIRVLLDGPKRYRGLAEAIPQLSEKVLTERMRELEAEGIVTRTVHPEIPVRVVYELTPKGEALKPVMEQVQSWADAWYAAAASSRP